MRIAHWRWLVAVCLPLLMGAGGQRMVGAGAGPAQGRLNTEAVPLRLGDWQGEGTPVSAEELARLDRVAELRRTYQSAEGGRLGAAVVYSSNWKGLHAAESCLTGAGWNVIREYRVPVAGEGAQAPGTVVVTRDKTGRQMVELYMFVNRQGVTANWIDQFWKLIKSRGRGEMACMFILNRGVASGQTPEAAAEVLRGFAQEMLPHVQASLVG